MYDVYASMAATLRRRWRPPYWLVRDREKTARWQETGRDAWTADVARKLAYAVADVRRGSCCPSWGDPRVDGDARFLTSPGHPRDPVHQPSWKRPMEGLE
jgi:hypothetical protein